MRKAKYREENISEMLPGWKSDIFLSLKRKYHKIYLVFHYCISFFVRLLGVQLSCNS